MRHFAPLLLIFSFFFIAPLCFSQTTLEGNVTEGGSGNTIMFAHVFLKSLQVGTTTDTSGHFKLVINDQKKTDTLIISFLGYYSEKIVIVPNTQQTLTIKLKTQFTQLQDVVINAGVNPAWAIMDEMVKNKNINNPDARDTYTCEEYSKIRFDLNHFTEKIKHNIMLRPFDFIWNDVDTTADGVTFLPVLLIEKFIDHYYQLTPHQTKDIVRGINTTGFQGPKIMNFVDDLYLTPNLYDNFVVILDKSFPSPINDNFKNHYDYYLDSVMIDSINYYKISFQPKYKRELAFTGDMIIDKNTFAIKQCEFRFDIMANVNFVRSYWVSQRYEKINDDYMPAASQVIGDFTVLENSAELTGFFGRKTSTYKNYTVNKPIPSSIFRGAALVVQDDSVIERSEDYWNTKRHVELSAKEVGVFTMVKQLEKDPAFIFRKNLVVALVTGYVPMRQVDIGNFYTFYSHNIIEHSRIKFGFRTGKKLSWPINFSAYGAYGTFDEKWKYGFGSDYSFGKNKKHRTRIGGSYKYDIEQLGRSFNQLEIDNILTSFVQYGAVNSRNYVKDYTAYIENNITTGLVSRVGYFNNTIAPAQQTKFNVISNDVIQSIPSYKASGLSAMLKFSYQKNDMNGKYYSNDDSKLMFRKYPDIALQWKWADQNVFNSGLTFTKFNLQLKQNVRMQKLGYFQYYVEAGKTWGTVPYPYLNIPFGNQLIFQDDYAFNLMNFLEYASDQFVSAYMQHHFNGLILDRIPLLNKLKWRSLLFARGYWSSLSVKNNQQVYLFPENIHVATKPYYEVGFGIENIFKIARIDFTWRLTDVDHPDVYRFIVKPSFKFSF